MNTRKSACSWLRLCLSIVAGCVFAGSAGAQTLINVDFGAGSHSLKTGFAATGQSTNDAWNLFRLDGQWSECSGYVLPSDEVCGDELDQNCDGTADEGCHCNPGESRACYTGPAATRNIGVCQDGAQNCVNELWAAGCDGQVLPSNEACDGQDHNCNGLVDDGCSCQNGAQRNCYTGPAATQGVGPCHGGQQVCTNGVWPGACSGQVTPQAESCNSADDDCDGQADEGDPGGGSGCSTGQPGICAAGSWHCQGGSLVCVPGSSPQPETCNGADDNCNGQVDEGDPGGGAACNTGQPGVCAAGTVHCQGAALQCVQNQGASGEVCDNLDNNCNGQVDEGDPGGGGACNTGLPGVCAAGILHCQGGGLQCVQQQGATSETCDGLDNNCNGVVDDYPDACGNCYTCVFGGSYYCSYSCCPTVFSHDGEGYRYESTVGGAGVIGRAEHLERGKPLAFAPLEVRLDRVRPAVGADGRRQVRAKVLASDDEIVYLDQASLTVVEHLPGHEILSSSSIDWHALRASDPGEIYALRSAALRPPLRASWRDVQDVTETIGRRDEHAVAHDLDARNYYVLDFGEVRSAEHARLVIDGWKLKQRRNLGPGKRHRPKLDVRQADGSWRRAAWLAPPRGGRKTVAFDLSRVKWPTGRYEMRLWTGEHEGGLAMWYVDAVRLTEEPAVPVRTRRLRASRAELGFSGAPSLPARIDLSRPLVPVDDGRGELRAEQQTFGRFTRYGDVSALVHEPDGRLVVMRRGDGLELAFADVPPPAAGLEQTFFLRVELVYKPRVGVDFGPRRGWTDQVEPLPLRDMVVYLPGRESAQAHSEPIARYLDEYNTRRYEPSDPHWGERRVPERARTPRRAVRRAPSIRAAA